MAASKRTAKKPKTIANKKAPAKKAPAKKAPAKKIASRAAAKPPAKKSAPKLAAKPPAKKSGPTLAAKTLAKKKTPQKLAAKPKLAKLSVGRTTSAKKAPVEKNKPRVAAEPVVTLAGKQDSVTPAREARQLLEQRKAIKSALSPVGDGKTIVDSYMRDVDHPFKAEMEAVRQIILGVSPKLSERIKWNAPSFYYKEDLGAFNPRATEFAHLILLFPGGGALPEKSPILEGTHKDRREVKFHGMDDVKAKQRALEKIIKDWVALRDS